ncbi:MAG: GIY-YIG nuclease family protein [Gammaproteobacteria bacterium]|nr:GIY-YIG nuclease family protein [Gammaproteobacteria bacterium]
MSSPDRFYIGLTQDLKRRFEEHNLGKSPHTKKYCPWKLTLYLAFPEKQKAENFEKYLKSGSGRTFAKNHF